MPALLRSVATDLQLPRTEAKAEWVAPATVLGLTALLFWQVIVNAAPCGMATDYEFHIAMAQRMAQTGRLETPHFLYQACVLTVHRLLPGTSFVAAGRAVAFASCCLTSLLIYLGLLSAVRQREPGSVGDHLARKFAGGLPIIAIAVAIAGPISVLTWRNFYLGYISATPHHSPTFTLLRPLAAIAFLACVATAMTPATSALTIARACGIGAIVAVSALAKPNFAMVLLPAAFAAAAIEWWIGNGRRMLWIAMSIAVPVAATLAWQYAFEYARHTPGMPRNGIEFAPFEVYCTHTRWYFVLPKFLLSIAFPLALLWSRPAILRHSFELRFAWLVFAAGCAFAYGFAESGPRRVHGNFLWCSHIGLFVLLLSSARALVADPGRGERWPDRLPWMMLKAQALCGFIYLVGIASGYGLGRFN